MGVDNTGNNAGVPQEVYYNNNLDLDSILPVSNTCAKNAALICFCEDADFVAASPPASPPPRAPLDSQIDQECTRAQAEAYKPTMAQCEAFYVASGDKAWLNGAALVVSVTSAESTGSCIRNLNDPSRPVWIWSSSPTNLEVCSSTSPEITCYCPRPIASPPPEPPPMPPSPAADGFFWSDSIGKSCDQVCADYNMVCDEAAARPNMPLLDTNVEFELYAKTLPGAPDDFECRSFITSASSSLPAYRPDTGQCGAGLLRNDGIYPYNCASNPSAYKRICFCELHSPPPSLPPRSPPSPPPAPIQPLQLQTEDYCARGTIAADECQLRAGGALLNSGSFSNRPKGCHSSVSALGIVEYYYNYHTTTTVACSTTHNCFCLSTDLHALNDFHYQTAMTIPAEQKTRIYHLHEKDGGILVAGDIVRYVPRSTLTDGSTDCPQWFSYGASDPDTPRQSFGGVLQDGSGSNGHELWVDVNLQDLDGVDSAAEYEFCYFKNSRRRKLQVIGNAILRGGGLLIVSAPSPSPPPFPPPPYVFKLQTHTHAHTLTIADEVFTR